MLDSSPFHRGVRHLCDPPTDSHKAPDDLRKLVLVSSWINLSEQFRESSCRTVQPDRWFHRGADRRHQSFYR